MIWWRWNDTVTDSWLCTPSYVYDLPYMFNWTYMKFDNGYILDRL